MRKQAMKLSCTALLLLAGCALQEKGQWVKPDATEAQWKQDNYQCTRDATYYDVWLPHSPYHWSDYHWLRHRHFVSSAPRMNSYLYEMCLEAKGYKWRPEVPK